MVLASGQTRAMFELAVGDRVLAVDPATGQHSYQDVYFFGHQEAATIATFVRLSLADGSTLTLTADHFVSAVPAGRAASWQNHVMMRAKDIRRGMHLFVAAAHWQQRDPATAAGGEAAGNGGDGTPPAAAVLNVELVEERGLYNPYTLGGMIVVDGVIASSHSAWVMDSLMDAVGLTHWVPATYQLLFAPIRALYHILGPARTIAASAVIAPPVIAWMQPCRMAITGVLGVLLCASKRRAVV